MVDWKEMYGPPHMVKESDGLWVVPWSVWRKWEDPNLQHNSHVRLWRFIGDVAKDQVDEKFDEEEFKRLERPWR